VGTERMHAVLESQLEVLRRAATDLLEEGIFEIDRPG